MADHVLNRCRSRNVPDVNGLQAGYGLGVTGRERFTDGGFESGTDSQQNQEFADSEDLKAEERVALSLSLVAAVPGKYTGPASRAYLYHTDEHKQWVDGLAVEIEPKLQP